MGVKGLGTIVALSPNGTSYIEVESLKWQKIAMDTTLLIYQFVIAMRHSNKGEDLRTSDRLLNSHLVGIMNKTLMMLANGVVPVYVLDGAPPDIKRCTLAERRKSKDDAARRLSEGVEDERKKIQLQKRTYTASSEDIRSLTIMLRLMGVPVVQAPGEAELQCAGMNIAGVVHGVVTEDWDALPFGSINMYKDFGKAQKKGRKGKKPMAKQISLQNVLQDLGLTHPQFVDICIILGTDYCPGIKGMGAENSYKMYKAAGNMKKFLQKLEEENRKLKKAGKPNKYGVPDNFDELWRSARDYYLKTDIYDPHEINTDWVEPNYPELTQFLINDMEWKPEVVERKLNRLRTIWNMFEVHRQEVGVDREVLARLFPTPNIAAVTFPPRSPHPSELPMPISRSSRSNRSETDSSEVKLLRPSDLMESAQQAYMRECHDFFLRLMWEKGGMNTQLPIEAW